MIKTLKTIGLTILGLFVLLLVWAQLTVPELTEEEKAAYAAEREAEQKLIKDIEHFVNYSKKVRQTGDEQTALLTPIVKYKQRWGRVSNAFTADIEKCTALRDVYILNFAGATGMYEVLPDSVQQEYAENYENLVQYDSLHQAMMENYIKILQ